ncbi:hypothetical protein ACR79B_23055, partial [Sphingobacterium spiritivorum]|uniref:hypothetical protein n=1 Tax=Sphingobacterium spiritivorum TaxID=258 RepID=UPI003DA3A442
RDAHRAERLKLCVAVGVDSNRHANCVCRYPYRQQDRGTSGCLRYTNTNGLNRINSLLFKDRCPQGREVKTMCCCWCGQQQIRQLRLSVSIPATG